MSDNVLDQFAARGLLVDRLETTGQLRRCKTEDDKGSKKSGWYVAHEMITSAGRALVFGRFGNWKDAGCPDDGWPIEQDAKEISAEEREAYKQQQAAMREKAAQEKQQRAQEAAKRAKDIWGKLPEVGGSEYLARKKVRAFGLRFSRGSIVVPVADVNGVLHGLQFINSDGDKKFLTGTAKRGRFALLGALQDARRVLVAEGYATGATLHMAMKDPVAVAFDAGNLRPVAEAIRGAYPEIDIVICGDDDAQTEGNPGATKAMAAAKAVGGVAVLPSFEGLVREPN